MKEFGGCPGSRMFSFEKDGSQDETPTGRVQSQLRQWPIQLHLVSPTAPYYQGADVLLAADCVPFTMGNFHADFLKGKALAIACPKLDQGQEIYIEKIKAWFEEAEINSLTVLIMEVPCCNGLVGITVRALEESGRKVPVKYTVVGLNGDVLNEEWISF
ncbi:MAG: 4Fe-4S ferredoxin [Deltaproteobacteria bacterium]|nr:4Fe-4S ferredoxin [Deltaproteobacteria bacterium]NIS77152.1 4Fe-4S ferredoxin [Deltaproteobacteria bacterium]